MIIPIVRYEPLAIDAPTSPILYALLASARSSAAESVVS